MEACLFALGVLVMLVLLISCASVANLMTAQATARPAGNSAASFDRRGADSGWFSWWSSSVPCWHFSPQVSLPGFAWWAAPLVVGMIGTSDNPVRLTLPSDWRVLGFGVAVALASTILFGVAPALRASAVKPVKVLLKGGDPRSRQRMMRLLVTAQVAFCVLVLFVAGLFMATSERLSRQRTGFSAERLLTLETVTAQPLPDILWSQVAERLRGVPGVEASALCEWPLMTGGSWNGFISVNGAAPGPLASYFLSVSPEWRPVMKIPLLHGRDFGPEDTQPGSALVNEAFVRQYLVTGSPVGSSFDVNSERRTNASTIRSGGYCRHDARYRDMRRADAADCLLSLQRQL